MPMAVMLKVGANVRFLGVPLRVGVVIEVENCRYTAKNRRFCAWVVKVGGQYGIFSITEGSLWPVC